MKRFLIFLLFVLMAFALKAQTINDTASLRNFINTRIVTNGSRMITGSDLNKIFNGITTLMKAYAVDSGYVRNDTLFLTRRGGFSAYGIKLPSSAGAVELDPTVSALVKSITAIDTARWNRMGVTSLYKKGSTDSIFMVYNGDTLFAYKDFRFEGVLTDETLAGYGHTAGAVLRVNTDIIARRDWVLGQGLSKWEYDGSGYLVPRSFGGSRLSFPKTLQLKDTLLIDTLKDGSADEYLITYDRTHKTLKKILKSSIGGGGGAVSSVFGRTGAVGAQASDYSSFYPQLSASYNNPTWINALAWLKITDAPDFVTQTILDAALAVNYPLGIGSALGATARAGKSDSINLKNWPSTTSALYYFGTDASNAIGLFPLPTGGGGGAVSSVFGRTGAVGALASDYSSFYPQLSASYNNPTWINALAWTKITGVPSFPTSAEFSALQDQVAAQQASADSAFVIKNTGEGTPVAYSVGSAKDTMYLKGIQLIEGSNVTLEDLSSSKKIAIRINATSSGSSGPVTEVDKSTSGNYNVPAGGSYDIFLNPGTEDETIATATSITLPLSTATASQVDIIRVFVGPSDAIDINSWGAAGDVLYSSFSIVPSGFPDVRIIDATPPTQAVSGDVFVYRRKIIDGTKTHWYRIK